MINFLDTSVILNGGLSVFNNIYISPLVLTELEKIKTSDRNEHIKYLAREAVRDILSSTKINIILPPQKEIDKILKKYNFLSNINDHRLLCEAIWLHNTIKEEVQFIASDGALALFSRRITGINSLFWEKEDKKIDTNYVGWGRYYPNEEQMALLYSNPELNVLKARTNEFCEVFEGNQIKDVLWWDGLRYKPLKYQEFKNTFGEKIAPRNLEQKMLFHLLQEDKTKIKLCLGGFGDGKTWCMLQHALKGIKDGRFQKIIFVRNNIITKGSRDIGFLGGSLVEKIKPFLMPITDLTTEDYLDELIQTGVLEPVPLGFMRGRDFSNGTLVFCDEAENLTKENVQLLIGRIGIDSELWMCGDLKQIDHIDFEKNNGINKMIDCLAGNDLFGMVKLIKSERSRTSQLADLMD